MRVVFIYTAFYNILLISGLMYYTYKTNYFKGPETGRDRIHSCMIESPGRPDELQEINRCSKTVMSLRGRR